MPYSRRGEWRSRKPYCDFRIKDWAKGELPFALGFLRLTPSEFYSFTIREWSECLKGWRLKKDNEIHEKAVIAINLMAANGNLKKGINFDELYKCLVKMLKGESDENGKKKLMTEEELAEFKKRFGIGD